MDEKSFKKGDTIFKENSLPENMYVLMEGSIQF